MPKGIKGFQKGHETSKETRKKIGDSLFKGVYYNCDYCGNESRTPKSHFIKKKLHFCNQKCYSSYREEVMQSHEHNSWKGGITKATQGGRGSKKYKIWQRAVYDRDEYKCTWCGSDKKIEADHIKRWAKYPKLKYEISNGRTLCMKCHNKTRNKKYYENKELLT